MNKTFILFPASVLLFTACQNQPQQKNEPLRPNIVYILVGDLGYGDLICYRQTHFQTPSIDMMAKNGLKFTQHYSVSTVFVPSHLSLMTGQHKGYRLFIHGNKEI